MELTAFQITIHQIIKCVQKDRDLWRIYVDTTGSSSKLSVQENLRNTNVRVYDTNPYYAGLSNSSENVKKTSILNDKRFLDANSRAEGTFVSRTATYVGVRCSF